MFDDWRNKKKEIKYIALNFYYNLKRIIFNKFGVEITNIIYRIKFFLS